MGSIKSRIFLSLFLGISFFTTACTVTKEGEEAAVKEEKASHAKRNNGDANRRTPANAEGEEHADEMKISLKNKKDNAKVKKEAVKETAKTTAKKDDKKSAKTEKSVAAHNETKKAEHKADAKSEHKTEQKKAIETVAHHKESAVKANPHVADKMEMSKEDSVHEFKKDETLWFISHVYYGTGKNYPRLMEANGLANPEAVKIGQNLKVPGPTKYSPEKDKDQFMERYEMLFKERAEKLAAMKMDSDTHTPEKRIQTLLKDVAAPGQKIIRKEPANTDDREVRKQPYRQANDELEAR